MAVVLHSDDTPREQKTQLSKQSERLTSEFQPYSINQYNRYSVNTDFILVPAESLLISPPHYTTTVLWSFFQDHPGKTVPEENFWTSWCKGRLREADTLTIRLGATPSGVPD